LHNSKRKEEKDLREKKTFSTGIKLLKLFYAKHAGAFVPGRSIKIRIKLEAYLRRDLG
jgi:hypothetical protein